MDDINEIYKVLADKNRIRILKMLENRKMCVCEITYVLGLAQASVSRHVKRLKKAGIIDSDQDGFWTNYYINPKSDFAKKQIELIRAELNDDKQIVSDAMQLPKAKRELLD